MAKIAETDDRIGRRLRLRDLRVFFAVVQSRSLAKAAAQLGVSQPAVSQVIAYLEHDLGVKLFDRSSRGVEPTIYASALLSRGQAAFDELRQGIREIEALADPASGELTIGFTVSVAATVLPHLIEQFSAKYPRTVVHVNLVPSPAGKFPGLRDRTYDLILARMPTPLPDDFSVDGLRNEALCDDPFVVVAGKHSAWARRRKIDLAELVDEPWILSPPDSWVHARVAEAFKARGLESPKPRLVTYDMDLRTKLPAHGRFISVVPNSLFYLGAGMPDLKKLPVDLPVRPWLLSILTLKNRTSGPVVERFIDCARDVAKTITQRNLAHQKDRESILRTERQRNGG
jgi:DNA-binding transcriptional LysR family regulator